MNVQTFFRRKEIWLPTRTGCISGIAIFGLLFFFFLQTIHGFLAVQHPFHGDILVVEGWLSNRILKSTIQIFEAGEYDLLITTGGPIGFDSYLEKMYPNHDSIADVARDELIAWGVPQNKIVSVPAPPAQKDRTYASVRALRDWLSVHKPEIRVLDVVSRGVHARRTRLLVSYGLGDSFKVGIYALENLNYDATQWWRSSEGIEKVVKETLGYLYAKFLFWPDD